MPKAKKETKYKKAYTIIDLQNAIEAVKDGLTVFGSAKAFGVPYNTLKAHINSCSGQRMGVGSHLSYDEENELKNWAITSAMLGYPRTWQQIRLAAYYICTHNHGEMCRYHGKVPGKRWLSAFKSRHPDLRTRTSESVSRASANVTEANIRGWFDDVHSWLASNGFTDILQDPTRIFGGDETSFHLSRSKRPVVFQVGTKNTYDVQQSPGHENVTVMYTFGAAGFCLKPLIVFKGKNDPKNVWGNQVVVRATEKGWMTSQLFCKYLEEDFVVELKKRNVTFPVLLFVDGHSSHGTLEVIETKFILPIFDIVSSSDVSTRGANGYIVVPPPHI